MKIICIGRNYGAHAQELGNQVPDEPVVFLKPGTALLRGGAPIVIPPWTNDLHHEIELVFRISRECRDQRVEDAATFIDGVTVGLDLTARDKQEELKNKGLPWEKAKAFDGSAVIGNAFTPLPMDIGSLSFSLLVNGEIRQRGRAAEMIFPVERLLSEVSRYITLSPGDLLFSGTPAGVAALKSGDVLHLMLGERAMLEVKVVGGPGTKASG